MSRFTVIRAGIFDHLVGDFGGPVCGSSLEEGSHEGLRRDGNTAGESYRPLCQLCATYGIEMPSAARWLRVEKALADVLAIAPWSEETAEAVATAIRELKAALVETPYFAALYEGSWRHCASAHGRDRWREAGPIQHLSAGSRCPEGAHWCYPAHQWGEAVELAASVKRFLDRGVVMPGAKRFVLSQEQGKELVDSLQPARG